MERLKIVGIGGSTASTCSSTRALQLALESAAHEGADTLQFEIRDMDLPLYREDHGEVPPYLNNKVVGLIATAGGVQGLQAINTMEYIVRSLRGWTVPLVAPISHAYSAFDTEGKPTDPKVDRLLEALGKEVVKGANRMR